MEVFHPKKRGEKRIANADEAGDHLGLNPISWDLHSFSTFFQHCLNSFFQCFPTAVNPEISYTFSVQHISFYQFQINISTEWLLLYFETRRMEFCDIFSLYHSGLYTFRHEPYYYALPKMNNLIYYFLSFFIEQGGCFFRPLIIFVILF